MKYLITLSISLLCLESFAAGTAWQNYPTTNSMGSSDTLMLGNGSTNLTITAGNFNSTQTQPLVNTASNNIMGYVGSSTNFVLLSGSNGPSVVGNALVITGTNASGATVVKGTNWPSGGGSTPNGLVTNSAPVDIIVTNAGVNTDISSNSVTTGTVTATTSFAGNGNSITNILHGNAVLAGSNIGVTPAQRASDGGTNYTVAVSDPMSLSQLNVGTQWATNVLAPTNTFAGTTVDFSKGESLTNLGGNLTFTAVANVTGGAVNSAIIVMLPGGSDRTIAFPASWHLSRGSTSVVSNAFVSSSFLFRVQPGIYTNVFQIDNP